MKVKVITNKQFHIPTQRIKEFEEDIKQEDELIKRINNMTDEEYETYVAQEIAKADKEENYISEEEFLKELKEDSYLLEREEKNDKNWKRLLLSNL